MNGRETRLSTAPVIFNPEESLNKYLLKINRSDLVADVESFTGEEKLSFPYRYTIRFTSTTDDAEAFHIVQKEASFILRTDNPARSPEVHNREVANLQWPMPPVEGFNTVPSEPRRKVG